MEHIGHRKHREEVQQNDIVMQRCKELEAMGATRNCSKSHASTSINNVTGLLSNQSEKMNI
jgi:hypothetical protein